MYNPPYPGSNQPYPASQPPPYGGGGGGQMRSSPPQVCLSWVPAAGGQIPPRALQVGNGVFVARARHTNEMIPCKVAQGHSSAFVPYGSQEHSVHNYEVLCDSGMPCFGCGYAWMPCQGFNIPQNAIVGGHTGSNEPLYIAKGYINGESVVGKVYAPHQCAYFPWGGKEHSSKQFEILVAT